MTNYSSIRLFVACSIIFTPQPPNDSFWNHNQGRIYTKISCPFDPNRLTTNLVSNIDWYVVKPANGKVI